MIPFFSFTQIKLFGLTFYVWGFFLSLAFLFGGLLFIFLIKKIKFSEKRIFQLLLLLLISAIIGSRLGYIFQFFSYYYNNPIEVFYFWRGGLMFYGGLLAALTAGFFYLKKFKMDFWKIADISVPAVGLGIFIGRIGCFLIKDHPGSITSLPWGIIWPDGIIRHPVAAYLSLNGFFIFLFFFWLYKKKIFKKGTLFILFLFWYGASRFFLDFLRANDMDIADPRYFHLTLSQWIGLALVFMVFIFLIKTKKKK